MEELRDGVQEAEDACGNAQREAEEAQVSA